MKGIYLLTLSILFYSLLNSTASLAQCGTNILTNAGYEAPVQPAIGNNLTGLFTFGGWTMTGGPFNVIRTNGTAYGGGPDNAQNGTQYLDITNAGGTIYQDFTITGATVPVTYGGYFSSREQGPYVDWTGSVEIYSMPGNTLVSTSSTRLFTNADGANPAQETWHYLFGSVTLAPGDYRYVVNLGNYGNFDAAFVYTDCVLPVVLNYFGGSYKNDVVNLKWKTEEQLNFSHFEIERSTDARQFTTIGNSPLSASKLYNFTDDRLLKGGTYYYRLKMVDKDGNINYSSVIIIKTKQATGISVTPNPVADFINISGLNSRGAVIITDASGKKMQERTVQTQSLAIPVSLLTPGVYFVQYFDGTQKQTQKIFKQ